MIPCMRLMFLVLILVLGTSGTGRCSVSGEDFSVNTSGGPVSVYTVSKALVIGVGKYSSKSWADLTTVSDDLEKVSTALLKHGFAVEFLPNPNAQQLRDSLQRFLLQPMPRDSRLLIYFAGHGWTDERATGYLVPTDALGPDQPDFQLKLQNMQEITDWSYKSKAKHVLMVFDSCFSGAIFLTRSNLTPAPLILADADGKVRQFITSGSADERVPAISDFAPKFVEGLNGAADMYADGIITANELGYWIKREIAKLDKQTPQYGSSNLREFRNGDFMFRSLTLAQARTPTAEQKPVAVAPVGVEKKRSLEVRSLGKPTSEKAKVFSDLEIIYFQKLADKKQILNALNAQEVPFVATRAELPERLKTNGIGCGPDVPIEAIKALAATLMDNGIELRTISTFGSPQRKKRRLEILSYANNRGGAEYEELDNPPLRREQIEALTTCPKILKNSRLESGRP